MLFQQGVQAPWPVFNAGAFVLNTTVTFGFNASKTKSNKVVSEEYPTAVTPKGYAFSIWGLIFGLQAAFTVWQLVDTSRAAQDCAEEISPFWISACVCQALWAVLFANRLTKTSTLALSGIVASLSQVYAKVHAKGNGLPYPYITKLPFAMHYCWTSIAMLLNLNIACKQSQCSPRTMAFVARGTLVSALLFGALTTWYYQDATFAAVAAWATMAIARNTDNDKNVTDLKPSTLHDIRQLAGACSGLSMLLGASLLVYQGIHSLLYNP